VVWDRSLGGIEEAGYQSSKESYQLRSIPPKEGYDPNLIFNGQITGKLVWGDFEYKADQGTVPINSDKEQMSDLSHMARIVNEVTKIINVPVMSDSSTNGLAGCLYNVTIPNIDNWRRFAQADQFANAAVVDLYANQLIGRKVVLNLMDGLVAQYAGAPKPNPNYSVHHASLLASTDPVAVDAVALQRIDEWRKKAAFPPIGKAAEFITFATQARVGYGDSAHIEVVNVDR